jgi:hypothetical protein
MAREKHEQQIVAAHSLSDRANRLPHVVSSRRRFRFVRLGKDRHTARLELHAVDEQLAERVRPNGVLRSVLIPTRSA